MFKFKPTIIISISVGIWLFSLLNLTMAYSNTLPPNLIPHTWSDTFYSTGKLSLRNNVTAWGGRLQQSPTSYTTWLQTATADFETGEFYQTQAISDSVRFVPISGTNQFPLTGTYTSTVFDAGRPVDWLRNDWYIRGQLDNAIITFRTGHTPIPDHSWSAWHRPSGGFEYLSFCFINIETHETECDFQLHTLPSGRFIQYQIAFNGEDKGCLTIIVIDNGGPPQYLTCPDLNGNVILYNIKIGYGTYSYIGTGSLPYVSTAESEEIKPDRLYAWEKVVYTATVPLSTSLTIDVISPSGEILIPNIQSGDTLTTLDPTLYPSLKLRASFITSYTAHTASIEDWEVHWYSEPFKQYLPLLMK